MPVTESLRMSRNEMLEVANMYFTGMQKNDGKMDYPFADDCDRIENGMQSTNRPTPEGETRPDPSDASSYSAQWSCMEQFQSGLIFFVNRIRDRRFVAVDEERGLVFAFVFFDHSGGEFRHGDTPNGRNVVAGPVQPWTWGIAEIFKVYDGTIHQIEAILERVPYGMNSGWSTWEQGMSDELQDVDFFRRLKIVASRKQATTGHPVGCVPAVLIRPTRKPLKPGRVVACLLSLAT